MSLVAIHDRPLLVLRGAELDVLEDEELGLWAEVSGIGDAALLEMSLSLARDIARIACVRRARHARLRDVADQAQRRIGGERVHDGGRGVGNQQHVALVDLLEAANARPVKPDALREDRFVEGAQRNTEMLPHAKDIGELEVHHPRAMILRQSQCLPRGHRHAVSPPSAYARSTKESKHERGKDAHCLIWHIAQITSLLTSITSATRFGKRCSTQSMRAYIWANCIKISSCALPARPEAAKDG